MTKRKKKGLTFKEKITILIMALIMSIALAETATYASDIIVFDEAKLNQTYTSVGLTQEVKSRIEGEKAYIFAFKTDKGIELKTLYTKDNGVYVAFTYNNETVSVEMPVKGKYETVKVGGLEIGVGRI